MLIPVLEDEIAFRMEYVLFKDLVRQCLQPLQGIRRIREDDIEFLPAYRQEVEHVVTHHGHITEAEAEELIGELVNARMYYIFGEDGTVRSLMEDEENPVDVLYTFETDGNLLIIHYSLDGAGEEIITVYEFALEGDTLSLTDETGDVTWLKREAE